MIERTMLLVVYGCSHEFPDTDALMQRRELAPQKKLSFLNKFKRALSLGSKTRTIRRPCMDLCPRCKAKERVLGRQERMTQSGQAPRGQPVESQPQEFSAPQGLFEGRVFGTSEASVSQPQTPVMQPVSRTPIKTRIPRKEITPAEKDLPAIPGLMETGDIRDVQAMSRKAQAPNRREFQIRRVPVPNLGPALQRRSTTGPSSSEVPLEYESESRSDLYERLQERTRTKTEEASKKQKGRKRNRQVPDQPPEVPEIRPHVPINTDHLIYFPRYSQFGSGGAVEEKESPVDPGLFPGKMSFKRPGEEEDRREG